MKKLFIIGNGFDLYHGLPTSYKCFNCFMCREHPEDHEKIGRIFDSSNPNMLWSDFENKLAELNISGLIYKNLSTWINGQSTEFENEFDNLQNKLTLYFQEWVKQINVACANSKRLELDETACFISFNYTKTLECLYQIDDEQICHIHNKVGDNPDIVPVFGHGKSSSEILKYVLEKSTEIKNSIIEAQQIPRWEDTIDSFEKRIIDEIKNFIGGLKKDTANIINNDSFFDKCISVDEIYVLGHSIAEVDLPYFEKIASISHTAKWYVSFYKDKKSVARLCTIPDVNRIEFITLDKIRVNGDNA